MNTHLYQYGRTPNTHDLIKTLGILLVLVDHGSQFLLDNNLWGRLLGRGAAPLFFFLIGYTGKLHVRFSLILYGIILSFTGFLFYKHLWINILLSFIFINLFFHLFDKAMQKKPIQIGFVLSCILLHPFLSPYIEYGTSGFLIAFAGRQLALKDSFAKYWLGISLIIYYLWQGYAFAFYQNQAMLTILGFICVGLYIVMSSYQLKPLSVSPFVRLPLLFLSLYSL
jgi:hypothetical protein